MEGQSRQRLILGGTYPCFALFCFCIADLNLIRSLAAASMGLYATGVSMNINLSYISSGGNIGNIITMDAECDRIDMIFDY